MTLFICRPCLDGDCANCTDEMPFTTDDGTATVNMTEEA